MKIEQEIAEALFPGTGSIIEEQRRVAVEVIASHLPANTKENSQLECELAAVTRERDDAKVDRAQWAEANHRQIRVIQELRSQLTAALARAEKAEEALRPLAAIADAWDANKLDDEARKHYGVNLEFTNMKNPDEIELYTGRGGKRLLILADCLAARAALTPTKEPAS